MTECTNNATHKNKETPIVANYTYINKQALLNEFEKWNFGKHGQLEKHFADRVFAIIDNVPTVDVTPREESEVNKNDR